MRSKVLLVLAAATSHRLRVVVLWAAAVCAAGAALSGDVTATAAAPATSQATDEIESLIRQLSSDEWRQRQDAEDRLVQLAGDAVPRLREVAGSSKDAEVRTRCDAALHRIAQNARIGPTIVTLWLDDATPRQAFEALAAQLSGQSLQPHPPNLWDTPAAAAPVTLHLDHVPFWEAFRQLSALTGLELRPLNDELRVIHSGRRLTSRPSAVSGPLLIVANTIQRSASIDLSRGATSSDFHVTMTVIPEPKLRVLRASSTVLVETAVDENGTSLHRPTPRQDGAHGNPRASGWPVVARLHYPPNAGKRIAKLRGSVIFTAQTQAQRIEIDDLLSRQNVRHDLGFGSLTMQSCRQKGGEYELVLVLRRGRDRRNPAWDQFRQSMYSGLEVVDALGRPLQRGTTAPNGSDERLEVTIHYRPTSIPPRERPGPPARLIWEFPTESREIHAPFEFIDLPMP